jgi:predicted nucleic acid-binding protein
VTLVDTSAWVEYLRDDRSETGNRVEALLATGDAAWCSVVVLELWNGITHRQRSTMIRLERRVPSLEIEEEVWAAARSMTISARSSGMSVPVADLIVAACARVHGVWVEHHGDAHFDMLREISIE